MKEEGLLEKQVEGRIGGWIQLSSGGRIWPLDPRPDEIYIEDIAHALSNLCRYGGHSKFHYSVGQHSLIVSQLLEDKYGPEMALYGLLHDASEAYLIDVPRPIKHSLDMAPYREAESRMERVICRRFTLSYPMPPEVKWADRIALRNEQRDLMPPPKDEWEDPRIADVWLNKILPMQPEDVRWDFLARFNGLIANRELTGLIGV